MTRFEYFAAKFEDLHERSVENGLSDEERAELLQCAKEIVVELCLAHPGWAKHADKLQFAANSGDPDTTLFIAARDDLAKSI